MGSSFAITKKRVWRLFDRFFFSCLLCATAGLIAPVASVDAAEPVETIETVFDTLPEAKVAVQFDAFPDYEGNVACVSKDGLSLIADSVKRVGNTAETELFQWDIRTQKILQSVSCAQTSISDAELSANGRVLVVGFIRGAILAWDLKSGRHIEFQAHEKLLGDIAVSPDGKNVVSGGITDGLFKETSLNVRDKHPSKIILKMDARTQFPPSAYSPDGTLLAGGISMGPVIVWDAGTLKKHWEQEAPARTFHSVFTPDSRYLLTVGFNGKLILWDAKTGEREAVMVSKGFQVFRIRMSPDGKTFATVGVDRETGKQDVVVWDIESRKGVLRYTLTEDQAPPTPNSNSRAEKNIAFLPDGDGLVVFGRKPFLLSLKDK